MRFFKLEKKKKLKLYYTKTVKLTFSFGSLLTICAEAKEKAQTFLLY